MASLASARSSCPRSASLGGGTYVVGEVVADGLQFGGHPADGRPGVRQRVADAGDERGVVDGAALGGVEQGGRDVSDMVLLRIS